MCRLKFPSGAWGDLARMADDQLIMWETGLWAALRTLLSSNRCTSSQHCPRQLSFDICTIMEGFVFVLCCLCGRELKSPGIPPTSHRGPWPGATTVKHAQMTPKTHSHSHVYEDIVKRNYRGCSSDLYEPGKYKHSSLKGL